jgi:SpoVK/Ycf46/Vps4 family AAA+-type ATPase
MLYTRFDAIVSSYLGETSANLRKVFEYTRSGIWVVLFDEFDAIGRSRNDATEHGELKRVVNSFLQLLDNFQGKSLIIAATNYEGSLDHALWRRFDEIIFFERPSQSEIRALLTKEVSFSRTAKKLRGMTHSEVEWICLEAIKSAILRDSDTVTQELMDEAIERQRSRRRVRDAANDRQRGIR